MQVGFEASHPSFAWIASANAAPAIQARAVLRSGRVQWAWSWWWCAVVETPQECAIEITREMKRAGAFVIETFSASVDSEYLAAHIYIAMARIAPRPRSESADASIPDSLGTSFPQDGNQA